MKHMGILKLKASHDSVNVTIGNFTHFRVTQHGLHWRCTGILAYWTFPKRLWSDF